MRFEYSCASGRRVHESLRGSYGLFIGGEFTAGSSVFKTVSPATEQVLAEVTHGAADDVDRAVAAARHSYERAWTAMRGRDRGRYLLRIARLLEEQAGTLAVLETMDTGKPVSQTREVDVPLAAAHFFYHAGWADKLGYAGFGRSAWNTPPRPLGVIGQVIGARSPLLTLAWRVAPALACGNTVILKPAQATPLTALAFAEICQQAGLPPGVVNVVTGDGTTGELVARHPGLDMVAFTGSAEVGKLMARSCALSGKRLALDLGGTPVNVVMADADLDAAADGIVGGVFAGWGRVHDAGARVLVQCPVAADLVAALRQRMGMLRLGDPLDPATVIGPVSSRARLDRIRDLAAGGEADGLPRWSAPFLPPDHGFWFPPTMFSGVTGAHRLGSEELAGPTLTVTTFDAADGAVERVNAARRGVAAGVWTRSDEQASWLASRLRTGVVWVNAFSRLDPAAPFGGYRESGPGRQGGRHGIEAYLDLRGGMDGMDGIEGRA